MNFIEDTFKSIFLKTHGLKTIYQLDDQKLFNFIVENNIRSQDLSIVLEELIINCKEHAKSEITFLYDKKNDYYTFVILDNGPGIHAKIPENIRLRDLHGKSSASILRLAVQEGITGTGVVGRGMGLYYLSKLVREKKATTLIASNGGQIIQQSDYFYEKNLINDIQGSCIIIQIHESEVGL